jgi:hypothetical protein
MMYRVFADVVVIAHFAFIVFVLLGGFLALRWHWIPWIHLSAVVWGAAIEFFGWICPLTPLEISLRRAGDSTGYSSGFIEHYLVPVIYPENLTRELQVILGCIVIVANIVIYLVVWRRLHDRNMG